MGAWADGEVERWTGVPDRRDLTAAAHWIDGGEIRRQRGLSLDLVVERDGTVAGEVGLAAIDRPAGTVDIGWWTAPLHRRRRVASTAAGLLAAWAAAALGLSVVAHCDPANPASGRVAAAAGFRASGNDGRADVWIWAPRTGASVCS